MAFDFLHRLIGVLKDYFNEVEEESVRDNFVIIYELLDEMMDNGYPQHTDVILRLLILVLKFKRVYKKRLSQTLPKGKR